MLSSRSRVAAALLAVVLVLALPLAADAHVRVYPKQAVAGADDTLLTFAVPNESATASTVKVVIGLPTGTPFGDVSFQPVLGWTGSVSTGRLPDPAKIDGATVTEAPVAVTFVASAGTRLTSGEFQDFIVSVGPMPHTGSVRFPTVQTYSNGDVVRWDEPTPTHGDEPEHPAPTVYIDDAPPADDAAPGTTASARVTPPTTQPDPLTTLALAVGIVALVAATGSLALVATRLPRRRPGAGG